MSWDIALLYFFSWNVMWFLQKEPIKMQSFRLLTAHLKFHQICTLMGSFYWKYIYKISAKKVQKSYASWYWRVMQNLQKNQFVVSKMTRICWILIRALKSLKKLHFYWSYSCKVYNVWPKKVQRGYLLWHWRVMQNLKKSWLVVWKMTWRIWQIFIRTLESVTIGTFVGSFCPK